MSMPGVRTLGYRAPQAAHHLAQWMQQPSTLLIDLRTSPRSLLAAWGARQLQARYGRRYRQAGAYLGNVNYKRGGPIQLANPEVGIQGLVQYLQEGYALVLLCGCPSYAQCHRKVVVDLLREALPEVAVEPEEAGAPGEPKGTKEEPRCS